MEKGGLSKLKRIKDIVWQVIIFAAIFILTFVFVDSSKILDDFKKGDIRSTQINYCDTLRQR